MGTKIRRGFSFWGRVQGVGFRYKMYYLAQKYNATGWVQNECNGSVTAQVQGEDDFLFFGNRKQQIYRKEDPGENRG